MLLNPFYRTFWNVFLLFVYSHESPFNFNLITEAIAVVFATFSKKPYFHSTPYQILIYFPSDTLYLKLIINLMNRTPAYTLTIKAGDWKSGASFYKIDIYDLLHKPHRIFVVHIWDEAKDNLHKYTESLEGIEP